MLDNSVGDFVFFMLSVVTWLFVRLFVLDFVVWIFAFCWWLLVSLFGVILFWFACIVVCLFVSLLFCLFCVMGTVVVGGVDLGLCCLCLSW